MKKLIGSIRHYEWGTIDAIPRWLGVEATGEPCAEYWLGAHPEAPAELDGVPLNAAIAADPGLLGAQTRDRFGDALPYLLKLLSAAKPLSLQTHPNSAQAAEGFARENAEGIDLLAANRSFRDPNAKPEFTVALSDFEVLVGFRDPAQTVKLFDQLGVKESLEPVIGPLRHRSGEAALAEVFLDALCLDDLRHSLVTAVVVAGLNHIHDDGALGDFARVIVRLDEHFPGDPSLLAALLLNYHRMRPGQAIHVRPGTLHSYLGGTCIEVMGNSDNVLRGGLTHKHIDPNALVQVVNFNPEPVQSVIPTVVDDGVETYLIDEGAFQLWRLSPSSRAHPLPSYSLPRIVMVWEGDLQMVDSFGDVLPVQRGQAAFLAAGEHVRFTGSGTSFLVSPGQEPLYQG